MLFILAACALSANGKVKIASVAYVDRVVNNTQPIVVSSPQDEYNNSMLMGALFINSTFASKEELKDVASKGLPSDVVFQKDLGNYRQMKDLAFDGPAEFECKPISSTACRTAMRVNNSRVTGSYEIDGTQQSFDVVFNVDEQHSGPWTVEFNGQGGLQIVACWFQVDKLERVFEFNIQNIVSSEEYKISSVAVHYDAHSQIALRNDVVNELAAYPQPEDIMVAADCEQDGFISRKFISKSSITATSEVTGVDNQGDSNNLFTEDTLHTLQDDDKVLSSSAVLKVASILNAKIQAAGSGPTVCTQENFTSGNLCRVSNPPIKSNNIVFYSVSFKGYERFVYAGRILSEVKNSDGLIVASGGRFLYYLDSANIQFSKDNGAAVPDVEFFIIF